MHGSCSGARHGRFGAGTTLMAVVMALGLPGGGSLLEEGKGGDDQEKSC